ncbi:phospholipid methyltransferase [Aureococcus anophagefferens]|nr:phospholipid methyltransferase [Aureococcus anophagefferens]
MAVSFAAVEPKFAAYHLSSMNVNFHLLTSLLGLLGAAGPSRSSPARRRRRSGVGPPEPRRGGAFGLWVLWGLALLCSDVPLGLALSAGRRRSLVAIVACRRPRRRRVPGLRRRGLRAPGPEPLVLRRGDAPGQLLGRWRARRRVVELFCEHVFYLLPLILASASEAAKTVVAALPAVVLAWGNVCIDSDSVLGLPWTAKKSRLLVGKFRTEEDVGDLAAIRRCVAAEHGDILAFDFHRESHYITMKPRGAFGPESEAALAADPTQKWRMVLKLHYAPQSALEKLLADVGVNGTTVAYNALEKYVGFSNLASYGTLAAVAYAVESYALFLYGTQFLPGQEKSDSTSLQRSSTLRYMSTHYTRAGVAFGTFKRDVLFFKTVALLQLFRLYAAPLWDGPQRPPYLVPIHVALYLAHLTAPGTTTGVPWFKQGKKEKKQEKKRGKKATKAA